jgi:hypothetical protein
MRATLLFLLLCVAGPALAHADTITLRSNDSFNGTVVRLTADQLVLHVLLANGAQKDIPFDRSKVARIEFNGQKRNVGEPPGALGAHDGRPANITPPARSKDTVIFREGGQNLACPGVIVTETAIQCGPKSYDRSEGAIWRINFGNP